jgi:hypothetical protein
MKTYLTYGFYTSLAGALLIFALYFLGLHDNADKLGTAQTVQTVVGLIIGVGCLVLGTKARRAEIPAAENFGYGSALGAGVMITLFAALFGMGFNLLYTTVINPGYTEVILEAQVAKFEAAGMSSDAAERATAMVRKMMHPAVQSAIGFVMGLFFGTLVSLVTAAFLKRPATEEVVSS